MRPPHAVRLLASLVAAACLVCAARAAEVMPPPPAAHFNDYAGVVDGGTAQALDRELAQFERDTSNQVVVAIFPHMESDSSIEDYTVRVAQSWHAGGAGRDNGLVLFAFMQEHRLYISVGYGLEAVVPDALCRRIIDGEMVPRMRAGDTAGAFTAGVHALMAASRGEYKGTGATVRESKGAPGWAGPFIVLFVILAAVLSRIFSGARAMVYGGAGRSRVWMGPNTPRWGGGGGFGGGFGGGGGGGGGGFSGGGGSFGGGGAGGSW